MKRVLFASLFLLGTCSAGPATEKADAVIQASEPYEAQYHSANRAMAALKLLSSDTFEGRKTGEPGNLKAMAWIEGQLDALGARPWEGSSYRAPLGPARFDEPDIPIRGTNLLARIDGTDGEDSPVIVLSAHFDHLGMRDGKIYNGADDNASGVAALLETMDWFKANPPQNTLLFAFFDAEEEGIAGSAYFVEALAPDLREKIAFNLNLDMVSRADKGELYAVGGFHHPVLVPLIDSVAAEAPIILLQGHDSPEWGDQDWSLLSDHAPFLKADIPFIYLGVEDHPDYHRPSDTFEKIDPNAYARCVDTIILMAEAVDDWVAAGK